MKREQIIQKLKEYRERYMTVVGEIIDEIKDNGFVTERAKELQAEEHSIHAECNKLRIKLHGAVVMPGPLVARDVIEDEDKELVCV